VRIENENISNNEKIAPHSRKPSFFHEVVKTQTNISSKDINIKESIDRLRSIDNKTKLNVNQNTNKISSAIISDDINLISLKNKNIKANLNDPIIFNSSIKNIINSYSETKSNLSSSKNQGKHHEKYFLEIQFNSKYRIENNIEEVFNQFLKEIKSKYKISNREDIYKLVSENDESEIFIMRAFLEQEDKLDKKSFVETNPGTFIKNLKQVSSYVLKKSAFSSFTVFDDTKQNNFVNTIKNYSINIEFYGLKKPSNIIINIIDDIIIEKKNFIKLKKFNQILINSRNNKLLDELGIKYSLNSFDEKSLIENSFKINETANDLLKNAKISWNKIFKKNLRSNSNINLMHKNHIDLLDNSKSNSTINDLIYFNEEKNSNNDFNKNKNKESEVINNINIVPNDTNNTIENKIFSEKNNISSYLFKDIDLKLIYEFSDKVNLNDIYPAFNKISNISKNFSEDMIEYFKIQKNYDLIVYQDDDKKRKTIIIPELNQYCFFITVIKNKNLLKVLLYKYLVFTSNNYFILNY